MTEATIIENKNRNAAEDASIAVAENARELDWKSKSFMASMFMGELDTSMCFPFPEQNEQDKAIGDDICAKVDAWAGNGGIDGEAIDREQIIPAPVFKGLNDLGLFGIKIPKEYGGLGLSQTNYMRILSTLARHCGSVSATLSAHQSIGVPQPLKLFGTAEQKTKFLPRFANGEISAFALTEPSVGSDPANMVTEATKNDDGTWTLNGEKLWCTNGVIADVIVVMAKTGENVRGGRTTNRISAFIVETKSAGVDILHRCEFMGIRAIENGVVRFTNVQVPGENIIWGEGKGLRLALTTLNDGRLGIPAIAADSGNAAADFCAQWGKSRHQWGKNIGDHEAGAAKLAFISGTAFAMDCMASFGAALSDRGDTDIRMEAAAAKLYNSEKSWELADKALQFRAGRGFETATSLEARGENAFPIERGLRDARINRIVEGTTDVMHLFLAREALDKHLSLAANLFSKKATMGQKLGTVVKAGLFYATWYPKLWLGGLFKSHAGFKGEWRSSVKWIDARCRKLARTLFHQMALNGPKLEMKQLTLARIVDIGTELAVMALVASRAQGMANAGNTAELGRARFFLADAKIRVDHLFAGISKNTDKQARKLALELMEQVEALPESKRMSDLLEPLPREFGSDLTSGRQTERLAHGGTSPTTSSKTEVA